MVKTDHYDVILETYKKQEVPLKENDQEFEKYLSECQDAITRIEKIKNDLEKKRNNLNQKILKGIENMQNTMSICEESALILKKVKEKQINLNKSKTEINNESEHKMVIVQEVTKDLKQLDTELQLDNVTTKIEDYKNKAKIVEEMVDQRNQKYLCLKSEVRTTDYKISSETKGNYKKKRFTKNLMQINDDIKRIHKNMKTVCVKVKELME